MALPIWGIFMKKVLADGTTGVYESDRFIASQGIQLTLDCDGSDADAMQSSRSEEEYYFD